MTTYAEIMAELEKPSVTGNAVSFAGSTAYTRPDHTVVRNGKIFEIGSFADKAFSFDRNDLERAVANFTPVPIDLEHTDTVLQGKMGHVQRIFAAGDGKSLMGEVHLPAWLDSLLESGERKVSAMWDRATKRLTGLALVRTPRITDAVLMAAFSADDEKATQREVDRMLSFTEPGRAVLRERGINPAMFSRDASQADEAMVNRYLSATPIGREILKEKGITPHDGTVREIDILRARGDAEPTQERLDKILACTPIGRAVLKDREAKR